MSPALAGSRAAPVGAAADRRLPTGVVTFVFTDIEGSTRLLADLGPGEYGRALDLHHEILRAAFSGHDGHEMGTEGDAFFVAFSTADDAVRACADAQRGLATADWPSEAAVRVRVGIHTGFARPRGDAYVAMAVNQAARIVTTAHGGQIMLSDDTAAELSGDVGVVVESLGLHRVRDFDQAVDLHRVVADGWVDPGRAARAKPAQGHNLDQPTTSLVGRDEQRAAVADLLRPGALVTLLGPGGIGKTRLAVEVGLAVAADWADGVWMVDLDAAASDELVAGAVVDALGAQRTPGLAPVKEVLAHLEARSTVVILDNCEHVQAAVSELVVSLQPSCPGVAFLATSRRALGLRGEVVHRLQPLSTTPEADDGRAADAVALFLERAGAIDQGQLPAVEELCRELDGLPLAVELAAAHARTLGPVEVLGRLRESHAFLRSDDPSLPDRQRSLRNLLDASVELLTDTERAVLSRAAVIAGPFGVDVCGAACGDLDLEQVALADALWQMTQDSLLVSDSTDGLLRFELPRTVGAHIRDRLDPPWVRGVARRLGQWLVDAYGPHRATGRRWVSDLLLEVEAVRGVIDVLGGGDSTDVELAQQLAWSIARLHEVRSEYRTGAGELRGHLDQLALPGSTRVGLLTLLADLHLRMDEVDQAVAALDEADGLVPEHGVPDWDEVGRLRSRGDVALRRRDYATAAHNARLALSQAASAQSRARAWNLAGIADASRGLVDDASASFVEEVREAEHAGLDLFLVRAHGNLAEARMEQGRVAEAARHQLASLDLARAHGHEGFTAYGMLVAARLVVDEDLSLALRLHGAALAALERSGHRLYEADQNHLEDVRARADDALGPDAARATEQDGRQLPLRDAADLAEQVLLRRSNQEDPDG